ncbi:odorant receptor 85a [Drosophila elegans]|uniref:odorant receptor 85a n=1 Tax=Drosophila elegans TaxID=30023 RepID=UPI0007E7EB8B|nr:odorant receptor 85a [Drosophila elegans]
MIFKYIQEPNIGALFRSRDSLVYVNRARKQIGWRVLPRTKPFWWLCNLWALILALLIFVYVPYALLMAGIKEFKNFTTTELFTYIQAPVNTSAFMIKIIKVFFLRARFAKALKIMDIMDTRCTKMEEKLQVHRSAALCNKIVIIYHFVYMGFLTMTVLGAVVAGKTPFCLYNPVTSPAEHLYLAIAMETGTIGWVVFGNLILDVYPVLFVVTLRTHTELLRQRINDLRSDPDKPDEQHYVELTDCIKDHKLIVELGNTMRPVISASLFIQLLSVGLLLGFCVVSLQFYTTTMERLASAAYINAIICQTFPCCYVCELLTHDCETLTNTLFHSNWIGADRRYRTTMLHFIYNAQKPILFNAGGIFTICIRTNLKLAKFAFSVVTIVNQMDLAEKLRRE